MGNNRTISCNPSTTPCSSFTAIYGKLFYLHFSVFRFFRFSAFRYSLIFIHKLVSGSSNVTIDSVTVSIGTAQGVRIDGSVQSITIQNSYFVQLQNGVFLSSTPSSIAIAIQGNRFISCSQPIVLSGFASVIIQNNLLDTITGAYGISLTGPYVEVCLLIVPNT